MPERLLFKNLPPDMDEAGLVALLAPICEARVLSGPQGEGVRRQATIEVGSHEEASRVVDGLDGRLVDGRRINVEWPHPEPLPIPLEVQMEEEVPLPPEPHRPPERPHRPERSPGR